MAQIKDNHNNGIIFLLADEKVSEIFAFHTVSICFTNHTIIADEYVSTNVINQNIHIIVAHCAIWLSGNVT